MTAPAEAQCFGLDTRFALLSLTAAVQAQQIDVGAGQFGLQLGYAHSIHPSFNLRADHMTAGQRTSTQNESGTTYQA